MNHLYKLLLVASILTFSFSVFAQPTITSFTPTSGAVGSSVTITGTNFNTTPANNIVWFGGVKGTVTAATSTSLTVTVPQEAASVCKIVVLTGGLIADSEKLFTVTFDNGVFGVYADPIDISMGAAARGITHGDFDNDGRMDIVSLSNNSNTMEVLENVSQPGTFNSSSFVSHSFSVGTTQSLAKVADFNGDGKLDIVIKSNSTNVRIFQNSSTGDGDISFGAVFSIGISQFARGLEVADLDGDGKMDIIVGYQGGTSGGNRVALLRNVHSSGGLSVSSFALTNLTSASTQGSEVRVIDVNEDSKPDIVFSNWSTTVNTNTVSVFTNNSTPGSLSFSSPEFFSLGSTPYEVIVADFDGDGLNDIIAGQQALRNANSVSGTNSFSSAININHSSASMAPADVDGDGKIDIVVGAGTTRVKRNTSSGAGNIAFGTTYSFSTLSPPPGSIVVTDLNQDQRPEIIMQTAGSNITRIIPAVVTYYARQNGNWSDPNTWSTVCGGSAGLTIPTPSDHVVICSSIAVTLDVNGNCDNLTIQDGGVLNLEDFDLAVGGNTSVSGTLSDNVTNGTATFGGTLTVETTGSFTSAGVGNASSFEFNGNIVNRGTFSLLSSASWTIQSALSVTNESTSTIYFGDSNSGTATMNANLTIADFTGGGNVVLNGPGQIDIAGGATLRNELGDYPTNSRALQTTRLTSSGTANFVNASGAVWNYNPNNGILLTGINYDFSATNNLVRYIAITTTQSVIDASYYHLSFINGATTNSLQNNISIAGTVNIGSTSILNSNNLDITIGGDWDNDNGSSGFVPGNALVTFNGAGVTTQNILGSTDFYALTINHTGSSNQVLIGNDISVNSQLTLTNGNLRVNTGGMLSLTPTGFVTGSFSNTRMIQVAATASVRKYVNVDDVFEFPVGTTGVYTPMTITLSSGTVYGAPGTNYVDVTLVDSEHPNVLNSGLSITKYWTLSTTGLSNFNADVSFAYDDSEMPGTSDETQYVAGYYNGSTWATTAGLNAATNNGIYSFINAASITGNYTAGEMAAFNAQAYNIVFANVGATQMDISWTNGSGTNRVVLMKEGSPVDNIPIDNNTYTANPIFGLGDQLSLNNYIVYNGSGSSVTVTGLTLGKTYYVQVFDYTGGAGSEVYITTTNTGNPASQWAGRPFITTWKTDNTGVSAANQITIPGAGTNYDIYWEEVGNEGANNGTLTGQSGAVTVTFSSAGTYRIAISGDFIQIAFANIGDRLKLLTIEQWGDIAWTSFFNAFYGCENLTYNATDAPNLLGVTSFDSMFQGCTLFNGDLSSWNTSTITDMSAMFFNATNFSVDLSSWDVSNVTTLNGTFSGTSINFDVSGWDISKVTTLFATFRSATFNNGGQPLNWGNKTANVINFQQTFEGATLFNTDISDWNTSSVTTMRNMFHGASSFNQDISSWDVSGVTNMVLMFKDATSFNQDLSLWDVASVSTMFRMFQGATSFNQDISSWNVSNVANMRSMFEAAISFNQNIGNWDVSGVTTMQNMFSGATSFDQSLGNWDVGNVNNMTGMLDNSGLSIANYDATIIGWQVLPFLQSGVTLGAAGLNYCNSSAERAAIVALYLWNFVDLGQLCTPEIVVYEGVDNTGTEIPISPVTTVDMGTVQEGNNLSRSFTIENIGDADLTISSMSFLSPNFTLIGAPTTVTAGTFATFDVQLNGASEGIYADELSIVNNDLDEATFNIRVSATITAVPVPGVRVYEGADNTGTQLTSGQSTQVLIGTADQFTILPYTFTIQNTGTADLNISDVQFQNNTTGFDLDMPSTPIAAGTFVPFTIYMAGSDVGTYTTDVVILSDDPNFPSFTFPVSGTVMGSPVTTSPEIVVYRGADIVANEITTGQTQVVNIGSSTVGAELQQVFTIKNDGDGDLTILGIGYDQSDSGYDLSNAITTVAPGTLETFTVHLSGAEAGTFAATLSIMNDDADENPFTFQIEGVIIEPINIIDGPDNTGNVILSNQEVNIGSTVLNQNIDKIFTIENQSTTSALTINGITSDNPVFEVFDAPTSIAPSSQGSFTVRMLSTSVGLYSSNLTVSTNLNDFVFIVTGEVLDNGLQPLDIYNVVTPNGDGVHDFFRIGNVTQYPNNKVFIYNRWGDKVFEMGGYDNSDKVFAGVSSVSGKDLDTGNYYFTIDKGNGSKSITGYLFLKW